MDGELAAVAYGNTYIPEHEYYFLVTICYITNESTMHIYI